MHKLILGKETVKFLATFDHLPSPSRKRLHRLASGSQRNSNLKLMKNIPSTFRTAAAFLSLMAVLATSANAQFIYASRVTGTTWTPPFWEIPNGGTAYATSAGLSGQSGLPTRVGCFYHSANTLVVGQGFGCQLTNDTVPGATWII